MLHFRSVAGVSPGHREESARRRNGTAALGTVLGEEKWEITDTLSLLYGHFWFHSVTVHNTPSNAGIQGLTIRNSCATAFYHYSRFSSRPIYLSWDDCAQQEGCSLIMLCDTVFREDKNPHVSVLVLTTGNSPVDQGVWCLVEDSIRCHSGTGVQHNIKSTHKETYGRGNSDEYTVVENWKSHMRELCSPSLSHFTLHSKMQIYTFILTLVVLRCTEEEWLNKETYSA